MEWPVCSEWGRAPQWGNMAQRLEVVPVQWATGSWEELKQGVLGRGW